jgi:hypothetical protein
VITTTLTTVDNFAIKRGWLVGQRVGLFAEQKLKDDWRPHVKHR